jgi:DNA-binding response OmpR family regulator
MSNAVRARTPFPNETGSAFERGRPSGASTGAPRIRLLLVDDDPGALSDLGARLEASGADVVGSTNNGEHAIDLARVLHPDAALIDWDMPHFGGALTARLMRRYAPDVIPVLLLEEGDGAEARALRSRSITIDKASSGPELEATVNRLRTRSSGGRRRPEAFDPSA